MCLKSGVRLIANRTTPGTDGTTVVARCRGTATARPDGGILTRSSGSGSLSPALRGGRVGVRGRAHERRSRPLP